MDDKGYTPLHWATLIGKYPKIIEILINNGANVNILSKGDHRSPLNFAISDGDENVITSLIKAGANVNNPNEDGLTPLHQSAKMGKKEYWYEANIQEHFHHFCFNWTGIKKIVEILLTNGANANAIDKRKNTPLHLIADIDSEKQYEIAELLVNAGADVNAKNKYDQTPSDVIYDDKGKYFS